jgi:hypothetical protein
MRALSPRFMQDLTTGFLSPLPDMVHLDPDLDLQIRQDYLNIYFKGNSLLRLQDCGLGRYRPNIHEKFTCGLVLQDFVDPETLRVFLDAVPLLKKNILYNAKFSIETEYEQLIIRANNYQPHNNSEYFILDRQVVGGKAGRFDLTGFFWSRNRRRKHQVVPLCLMEVKYALNRDIQHIDEQVKRYFNSIDPESFAQEAEIMLQQKLELGLFKQRKEQLEAMKTLTFFRELKNFRILLILIDYNPHSKLFDPAKLTQLDFANQVRVLKTGMAMWEQGLERVYVPEIYAESRC